MPTLGLIAPPPIGTPAIIVPEVTRGQEDFAQWIKDFTGKMTRDWVDWLTFAVLSRVQSTATTLKVVTLTGRAAAIGTTPIPLGVIAAGLYRVATQIGITTPAGVSSSATLTISWTRNGVARSKTFPPITGNTTATADSQVLIVRADANAAISYAVAYASGPAGMTYELDVSAEVLSG